MPKVLFVTRLCLNVYKIIECSAKAPARRTINSAHFHVAHMKGTALGEAKNTTALERAAGRNADAGVDDNVRVNRRTLLF